MGENDIKSGVENISSHTSIERSLWILLSCFLFSSFECSFKSYIRFNVTNQTEQICSASRKLVCFYVSIQKSPFITRNLCLDPPSGKSDAKIPERYQVLILYSAVFLDCGDGQAYPNTNDVLTQYQLVLCWMGVMMFWLIMVRCLLCIVNCS